MSISDSKTTAALVGQIYDAALHGPRWSEFLTGFAARLNSHAGLIWTNDFGDRSVSLSPSGAAPSATLGFDSAALESFSSYYGQRNVWLEDSRLHREGQVVTGSMLYPDSQLKKTEYWGDWLRPQDMFYTAAAVVEKREERSFNVTLVRSERAGAYTAEELALVQDLMPHLQSGLALHRRLHRLEALSHSSTQVLEALPFGVVLLDETGSLVFASAKALGLASSVLMTLRDGRPITCLSTADDAALQRLVQGAVGTGRDSLGGGSGGCLRLGNGAGPPLQLLVTPLPLRAGPFGQRAAAAVFFSDAAAVVGSLLGLLRSTYRMTPAEARLTEALVNGRTLQEYADAQQLSMNTLRTQLRAVMTKVGVGRQAELVRVVLTGPAVLRWSPQAAL